MPISWTGPCVPLHGPRILRTEDVLGYLSGRFIRRFLWESLPSPSKEFTSSSTYEACKIRSIYELMANLMWMATKDQRSGPDSVHDLC